MEGSLRSSIRLAAPPRSDATGHLESLRPVRLIVLYALLSYAMLIALTASAIVFGDNAVRQQIDQSLLASATASANLVGQSLQARGDALGGFTDRPLVISAMEDQKIDPTELATMDTSLWQLADAVGGADSVAITDASGYVLDSYPNRTTVGNNLSYRDWFRGAVSSSSPYLGNVIIGSTSRVPLIPLAKQIVSPDGRLLGVMVVTFQADRLDQYVKAFDTSIGVQLTIADRAGNVVARPEGGITQLIAETDPDIATALRGVTGNDNSSGRTMEAYAPVPWAGWALTAEVPVSVALAGLNRMTGSVALIAFILALANLGGIHLLRANLTSRFRAEAGLKDLNTSLEARVATRTAALEASNRELDSFAYSVSHDLRAPLRAMSGFANLLLDKQGLRLDADARQYAERIDVNAKKMGSLIDELLRFSRLGRAAMTMERIDPTLVAKAAIQDLAAQAKEGKVEVVVDQLPPCICDPALIKHVYANLIGNAIKFSRGRPAARVEVSSHLEGGHTVYDVRDNGVGFDMRYADKLFGVFQRLHSEAQYEGTGVGLAIVQKVIQRHSGRVWAEAIVDKGATFHFTVGGEAT